MCDVCKSEGKNWEFMNGRHKRLKTAKLYSAYEGRIAKLQLCKIHEIELFMRGETQFLEHHMRLAMEIAGGRNSFVG